MAGMSNTTSADRLQRRREGSFRALSVAPSNCYCGKGPQQLPGTGTAPITALQSRLSGGLGRGLAYRFLVKRRPDMASGRFVGNLQGERARTCAKCS
jgi:hypothetical protein